MTNSLITIIVLLTGLPAVASTQTINTTRYSISALSVIAIVYSTLSLLLAPKVVILSC